MKYRCFSSSFSRLSGFTIAGWLLVTGLNAFESIAQTTTAPSDTAQSEKVLNFKNQATANFDAVSVCGPNTPCTNVPLQPMQTRSNELTQALKTNSLVDPLGQVTGCAGEILPDYEGFSIAVYDADPSDPTGASFKNILPLTQTEVPDNPNNTIPGGLNPNAENSNPFFLTNSDRGVYNFLLDLNRGQLDRGRAYILVVKPPANSIYSQRRIRLVIGDRTGNSVSYTASSLDGKPISTTDGRTSITGTLEVKDAAQTGLNLTVLNLNTSVCQAQEIQIIKTGDRATAATGDTVIYRLSVRNLSSAQINNLSVTDTLPIGFDFREKSARAELKGNSVPVVATQQGRTVTFTFPNVVLPKGTLDQNAILNIAYAALLTPDAIRGNGRNTASAAGQRLDNLFPVKDGPAVHNLRIRNGVFTDCGTILGRVFVDKNFDGEQQPGEPGIPNAVVFLDDGNRITTDANGLFSVANVLPGHRTGVLDLSSLPGYTLAPNQYFQERNSQSRLVQLEPGGMVRMNFAVTPTFQEGDRK